MFPVLQRLECHAHFGQWHNENLSRLQFATLYANVDREDLSLTINLLNRRKMIRVFPSILDLKAHKAKIKDEKEMAEFWAAFDAKMDQMVQRYEQVRRYIANQTG